MATKVSPAAAVEAATTAIEAAGLTRASPLTALAFNSVGVVETHGVAKDAEMADREVASQASLLLWQTRDPVRIAS